VREELGDTMWTVSLMILMMLTATMPMMLLMLVEKPAWEGGVVNFEASCDWKFRPLQIPF